jgi:hypothetical protein
MGPHANGKRLRETVSTCRTAPTQAKSRLEWATGPRQSSNGRADPPSSDVFILKIL